MIRFAPALEVIMIPELTTEDAAEVVSLWTQIPVTQLTKGDMERLRHLEKELHKHVIGQDEAVNAVAKAVKRSRVGLKSPNRPIRSSSLPNKAFANVFDSSVLPTPVGPKNKNDPCGYV